MIRVLVVDDHNMFRQGIVSLLSAKKDIEVVAEAASGADAIKLAKDLRPDIVVLDMALPDMSGIDVAKNLFSAGVSTEIVVLTMYKEKGFLKLAGDIGIKGYLLKDDAFDDLHYAIKAISQGNSFTSSSFARKETTSLPRLPDSMPVTPREKEIIIMIAQGLTSREIAKKLSRSVKTIETHRTNIMEKLGLKNVADIVRYAYKSGLIGHDSVD